MDIQYSESIIRDNNEEICGVIAFLRDITEWRKNRQRLELLHYSAIKLSQTDEIDEIIKLVRDTITNIIDLDKFALGFVRKGEIVFLDSQGEPISSLPLDGKGVTIRAVLTKEIQYVPDTSKDPDYVLVIDSETSKSELAVPIINNDVVLGLLDMGASKINAFTERDLKIIELLCSHIASALIRSQNKELQDELIMLHQAIEQSANSVIITDLDGNIEYVNPSFTRFTGYSYEEVLGENPRIIKGGELSEADYKYL